VDGLGTVRSGISAQAAVHLPLHYKKVFFCTFSAVVFSFITTVCQMVFYPLHFRPVDWFVSVFVEYP
jgi:hypothetical protein